MNKEKDIAQNPPKKKPLLDNTPKIPKFDAAQWMFIDMKILDGYEPGEILELFRDQFYNGNGYCRKIKEKQIFTERIRRRRLSLKKKKNYVDVLSHSKNGLAKKEGRLRARKKHVSKTMLELERLKDRFPDDDKAYLDYYVKLKRLLLKELQDLALEMGEWQTSQINVNVDQRKVIFQGRAVLPELDKSELKELEVRQVIELPEPDGMPEIEEVEARGIEDGGQKEQEEKGGGE